MGVESQGRAADGRDLAARASGSRDPALTALTGDFSKKSATLFIHCVSTALSFFSGQNFPPFHLRLARVLGFERGRILFRFTLFSNSRRVALCVAAAAASAATIRKSSAFSYANRVCCLWAPFSCVCVSRFLAFSFLVFSPIAFSGRSTTAIFSPRNLA